MMKISVPYSELKEYVCRQINYFFPDSKEVHYGNEELKTAFDLAMDRTENCFKHITLRGYKTEDGNALFSHLHSDQYSQFLYFLSNSLWKLSADSATCSKIISLNKMLNGMFYSYKCNLPDVFLFAHPVGSIIGNASYSDGLVIFQNVTINTGDDLKGNGDTPKLGRGLFLGAGAKIIGQERIGDRVSIGVDALVYNKKIEDDMVVLRDSVTGELICRKRVQEQCMAQKYFDMEL